MSLSHEIKQKILAVEVLVLAFYLKFLFPVAAEPNSSCILYLPGVKW